VEPDVDVPEVEPPGDVVTLEEPVELLPLERFELAPVALELGVPHARVAPSAARTTEGAARTTEGERRRFMEGRMGLRSRFLTAHRRLFSRICVGFAPGSASYPRLAVGARRFGCVSCKSLSGSREWMEK
jgi:hypothetical protein